MYNQKYKKLSRTIMDGPVTGKTGFPRVVISLSLLFWTIKDGPVPGKTGSPVSSFLSYAIFWLIPI